MTAPAPPRRRATPFSWLLLVLGACGFAAVWVLVSLYADRQASWMAVFGALDIAWMLRLGGWPRGWGRAVAGVVATGAIVALANWGITATQLGATLGFDPLDSAFRLGAHHAWILIQLANGLIDQLWIAGALVLAALLSR